MPLTLQKYQQLRSKYKGKSAGTKFRKLVGRFGRYDPNKGSLERLNAAVRVYCGNPNPFNLVPVHDAIEEIAKSPKVEKYGQSLAELQVIVGERPLVGITPGHTAALERMGRTAHPLVTTMLEAQQDAAYRVFVEGSYEGKPIVSWKLGAISATMLGELAETSGDRGIDRLASIANDALRALRPQQGRPRGAQRCRPGLLRQSEPVQPCSR